MSIWNKFFGGSEPPSKSVENDEAEPTQRADKAQEKQSKAKRNDPAQPVASASTVPKPAAPQRAKRTTVSAERTAGNKGPPPLRNRDIKLKGRQTLRGDLDPEPPAKKATKTKAMGAMAAPIPAPEEAAPKTEPTQRVPEAQATSKGGADTLDSEVDALFDAAIGVGGGAGTHLDARPEDLNEMFEAMVGMHLRPLRDLMLEVRWGIAPSSWIGHCRVALETVQSAAQELDRPELVVQLHNMASALDAAAKDGRAEIPDSFKGSLLKAYAPLVKLAPEQLSLEEEHGRREPVMVRALLLQAQDVEHVTVSKLFGAGLSTMQGLLSANAEDISNTADVPSHLSRRIMQQIVDYKRQFGPTTASVDHSAEAKHLSEVLEKLRDIQTRLERVERQWSEEARAQKRALRKKRTQLIHHIALVLARMGETEFLKELERRPIAARIEQLGKFVQDTSQTRSRAQAG